MFAPLLAAGGWRVVSWDQRGHGDSDRADLYSWDADLRDALAVFDHVSPGRPVPVVGHSKGGGMMIQLADAQPYRIATFVNLDGIPYSADRPRRRRAQPDEDDGERGRRAGSSTAGARSTASASRARSTSSPSGGPG